MQCETIYFTFQTNLFTKILFLKISFLQNLILFYFILFFSIFFLVNNVHEQGSKTMTEIVRWIKNCLGALSAQPWPARAPSARAARPAPVQRTPRPCLAPAPQRPACAPRLLCHDPARLCRDPVSGSRHSPVASVTIHFNVLRHSSSTPILCNTKPVIQSQSPLAIQPSHYT